MAAPDARKLLHAWTSHHYGIPVDARAGLPVGKHAPLVRRLVDENLVHPAQLHRSRPAPLEWLYLAHDPAHVDRIVAGRLPADELRRLGLPWSLELVARARAGVYGTVMAASAALRHGVAGNLAGGAHHALRDRAQAYCLFNDLAIAIELLRREGRIRRPFVLDLDVHQGDGTAAMFVSDPMVFTFSIHAEGNFPAHKQRGSFDLGLRDGCEDEEYLAALERHLLPALESHRPDLVLYQAGVDALAEDRIGRLALTREGLARRDARVFAACEQAGAAIAITLGGGYAVPIEASIEAHLAVWRAARAARDRRPAVTDGDADL
jgi:acetoin utilization deacetylase AcuC-like enzyme